MNTIKIRLLVIEDSEDDAILLIRLLKESGFELEYSICEDRDQFEKELQSKEYDLIISDYNLNGFTGVEAYEIYEKTGKYIPFIIVSGAIGEELAVEAMRRGVHDYVMKDRLERLIPTIHRELNEAKLRAEQSRTAKALEVERSKFQLLVENAPIAIIIVSLNDEIEYVNAMAVETFGYAKGDFTTVSDLILKLFADQDDRQWVWDFWHQVFNPQKVMPNIDFPMVRSKNGSPKFIKFKTAPISESSFIIMAEDITNQKIAAITLEKNQKRLAKIFNAVEDIIIEIILENQEYIITNTNKSFSERTGLHKIEVVNRSMADVFCNHSDIISSLGKAIENRSTINLENQVEFKKGKRFWEIFISPLFTDDGELYRLIFDARDLTERKQQEIDLQNSEKKFRTISSIASDAIWEWSVETNYIEWNDGITTLFGYKKNSVGHSMEWVRRKVHHTEIENVEKSINSAVRKQYDRWKGEFRFKCSDGSYKKVIALTHIFYNHKKAIKIIGVMVDLTHRLKAEELRIQSLVEGADNERKIIAEELHDNLGQNLSLASILLDQLSQEYNDKKLEKTSAIIQRSIQETRSMAHSLMPKTVNDYGIKAAILSLIDTVKLSQVLKVNTYFNFDSERFTPKVENNLYRIVQETLNNIIKHAKARTVFIQMLKSEGALTMTIEDDGVGFDMTNPNSVEGIGLKNIENRVYYLNGNLTIESRTGKGAFIMIELPLEET